mmetsp:Transcript_23876/g.53444  ORF Transcript_23876/g.53444 Transcript_23876/m.53444 type:complete len:240 (-) Transcript_23876:131-850(-)
MQRLHRSPPPTGRADGHSPAGGVRTNVSHCALRVDRHPGRVGRQPPRPGFVLHAPPPERRGVHRPEDRADSRLVPRRGRRDLPLPVVRAARRHGTVVLRLLGPRGAAARDGGPPRPGVRVRHGRPGCAHRRPPVPRRAPPRRDHRARRPDRALRPVQDGVRGQEVPCHGARGPSGRGDDRGVRDVRRPPRGGKDPGTGDAGADTVAARHDEEEVGILGGGGPVLRGMCGAFFCHCGVLL